MYIHCIYIIVTGGIPLTNVKLSTSSSEVSFASEKNVTSHKRSASDYAVAHVKSPEVRRVHSASAGDLVSSSSTMTSPSGTFAVSKIVSFAVWLMSFAVCHMSFAVCHMSFAV